MECVNPYGRQSEGFRPRCEATGKVIYRDSIDAQNAVERGRTKWGANTLRHYLCGGCGKFHIGNRIIHK